MTGGEPKKPVGRPRRGLPRDGAAGDWPAVQMPDHVNEVARRFALNVREAMGEGASIRSAAKRADIDHNTLRHILEGSAWPDLIVIAKLERAFCRDLWPGRIDDE